MEVRSSQLWEQQLSLLFCLKLVDSLMGYLEIVFFGWFSSPLPNFRREIKELRLKRTKKVENVWKKWLDQLLAFGCAQHSKAGRNKQQRTVYVNLSLLLSLSRKSFPFFKNWGYFLDYEEKVIRVTVRALKLMHCQKWPKKEYCFSWLWAGDVTVL